MSEVTMFKPEKVLAVGQNDSDDLRVFIITEGEEPTQEVLYIPRTVVACGQKDDGSYSRIRLSPIGSILF